MPFQKTKHDTTSNRREQQRHVKSRERKSDIASLMSSWLGLSQSKHVDKSGPTLSLGSEVDKSDLSHSTEDEVVDKGGSSYSLRGEDGHAESMTIAPMLSSWLGLTQSEQVNMGGPSHSSRGEDEEAKPETIGPATANTETTEKATTMNQHVNLQQHHEIQSSGDDEAQVFDMYVNSNCQGINNSIMVKGSYTSNDPGVHIDINDVRESQDNDQRTNKDGFDMNDYQ